MRFKFNEEAVEAFRRERDEDIGSPREHSFLPGPNPLGLAVKEAVGDSEGVLSPWLLEPSKYGEEPGLLGVLGNP